MKRVALIIAVESYADDRIEALPFAAADAARFDAALAAVGYADADRTLLLDGQATKTAIESKVRRIVKTLTTDDEFLLFYAGRTFFAGHADYLTCHDTQADEPVETSLNIEELLIALSKAKCAGMRLFVDCAESDLAEHADEELGSFDDEVCADAIADPRFVVALSRSVGQLSHRSPILQAGIWAHHLCEAFAGAAKGVIKNGALTSDALRTYLDKAVPRTLTATYTAKKKQTPLLFSPGDVVLAESAGKTAKAAPQANDGLVRQVVFLSEKRIDVKALPGFNKKTHRVPDAVSRYNETFVAGLAHSEIKEDLDTIYARLKKFFRFARADLSVAEPGDGTGSIVTPFFNYSINVALDPENPARTIWTRMVDAIKDPPQVVGDAFADVFDDRFDRLNYALPEKLDLEAFIDAVEARKSDEPRLSYDRDATYCELRYEEVPGVVRITPRALTIEFKSPQSPRTLLRTLQQVKSLLDGDRKRGLPQPGKGR
ncbi:MAG: caspase family protein [Pirellulales bacterium]